MSKQGQGKAAGCFLGSSHHDEKPEAKQEGTFCSEPAQAKAKASAPPPPSTIPFPLSDQAPEAPLPQEGGMFPKKGQRAEAPNGEVIFEAFLIVMIFTHTK